MRVAIKKLMIPCDEEVALMSSIRHRNIVLCLGYCANPPEYCMVIELAKYNLKHVRPDRTDAPAPSPPTHTHGACGCARTQTAPRVCHPPAPPPLPHRLSNTFRRPSNKSSTGRFKLPTYAASASPRAGALKARIAPDVTPAERAC